MINVNSRYQKEKKTVQKEMMDLLSVSFVHNWSLKLHMCINFSSLVRFTCILLNIVQSGHSDLPSEFWSVVCYRKLIIVKWHPDTQVVNNKCQCVSIYILKHCFLQRPVKLWKIYSTASLQKVLHLWTTQSLSMIIVDHTWQRNHLTS